MPKLRRRRFNDDVVVVTRRRVKPKSVPTKKIKAKAPLAEKNKSSKSDQNIKAICRLQGHQHKTPCDQLCCRSPQALYQLHRVT